MKLYQSILSIVLGTLFLISCNDDDSTPVFTRVEASKLNTLPIQSAILTPPATGVNPQLCTFSWSETQFYFDGSDLPTPAGSGTYTLEADLLGNNFASAQIIAVTTNNFADVTMKEMNSLLIQKLGVEEEATVDIEIRLITTYGEGIAKTVLSDNTLTLTLTTYAEPKEMPAIYIIGDMNGWNNTSTDYMMFRDDSDTGHQIYTYTGKFGGYFKFCPEDALGSWNLYSDAGNGKLVQDPDGGAFFVDGSAYKTITLNLSEMTLTIEDYDISQAKNFEMINFIGQFCNWGENDSDPAMTRSEYDPHQWRLVIELDNIDYGVKFRASHSWDNRWCPPNPNDVAYGKAEYNPEGQDNNISLTSLGKYDIRFNDLTGHYIFILEE